MYLKKCPNFKFVSFIYFPVVCSVHLHISFRFMSLLNVCSYYAAFMFLYNLSSCPYKMFLHTVQCSCSYLISLHVCPYKMFLHAVQYSCRFISYLYDFIHVQCFFILYSVHVHMAFLLMFLYNVFHTIQCSHIISLHLLM